MKKYTERIERWKIVRKNHKSDDKSWLLVWSFDDQEFALKTLMDLEKGKPPWWEYKLVDGWRAEYREQQGMKDPRNLVADAK